MTIVSHQHRFIHIKARKVAGTSAEVALSRYCGPADFITPVNDEELRVCLGGRRAQHYRMVKSGASTPSLDLRRHMPAAALIAQIGRKTWDNYFTFCFERHSWDKAVSYYFWRKHKNFERCSFQEFIRSDQIFRISDWDMYADDNGPMVDFIGQYHRFQQDWEALGQRLGLAELWPLPHTHSDTGRPTRAYREHYKKGDQEVIANVFRREIEHFGYEF